MSEAFSHRDFLAKISGNRVYMVNPQASWNFSKPRQRPNLIPRFSSQAEIELVSLARPEFKLPSLSKHTSHMKSFVLSSPSASFNRLLVDENLFNDSPIVVV